MGKKGILILMGIVAVGTAGYFIYTKKKGISTLDVLKDKLSGLEKDAIIPDKAPPKVAVRGNASDLSKGLRNI
jgi:hypothetical protein